MYLLDTDQFSLVTHGNLKIINRIRVEPGANVAISIVTVEEQLTGWYAQLRRWNDHEKVARAYTGMFRAIQIIQSIQVLPFPEEAIELSRSMRRQHRRLGRMDLSIAAIALNLNATLVTRNRIDFGQIPGLKIEDWSQPESGDADHA